MNEELITYDLVGTLHADGDYNPWVSFILPAKESCYFAPTEYSVSVPADIDWVYYSCGEFLVGLTVTFNVDLMEIVSVDNVYPRPDLPGGF